jgi:type I restriction enzyme S subunit
MPEAKTAGARVARQRFKPYPEYKDSGVEWLGKIPAGWVVKKLWTIASIRLSNVDKKSVEDQVPVRLCNYVDVYYHERVGPDLEFMAATATPEQVQRFSLRAGDVLITKDSESWTDIAVPAEVSADLPDVLCGYHLAIVRPAPGCDGAFLARAFSAVGPRDQFQIAANGITRFGLGGDAIRAGLFATPPAEEQRAIGMFLDRETARIDALVAKKERLIELLQEKRTALVTRAVTKGLDPNVPMKDSGVEWLGEIPAHWEVWRLKHVSGGLTVGVVVNPSQYVSASGVAFLRGVDVTEGRIVPDCVQYMSEDANMSHHKSILRAGDLVSIRVGYPGVTAVVPTELDGSNCASLLITRRSPRIDSELLCHLMNSAVGKAQFKMLQDGAAQEQINVSDAVDFLVPLAPRSEQTSIAQTLSAATARIDALIAKVREAIALLKEYRTALISAAVTGKIDVRGEAA